MTAPPPPPDALRFAHWVLGCARHSERGCECGLDWCTAHPEQAWTEQGCPEACRVAPLLECWAVHRENLARAVELGRWAGWCRETLAVAAGHDTTGQLHAVYRDMARLELEMGLAASTSDTDTRDTLARYTDALAAWGQAGP